MSVTCLLSLLEQLPLLPYQTNHNTAKALPLSPKRKLQKKRKTTTTTEPRAPIPFWFSVVVGKGEGRRGGGRHHSSPLQLHHNPEHQLVCPAPLPREKIKKGEKTKRQGIPPFPLHPGVHHASPPLIPLLLSSPLPPFPYQLNLWHSGSRLWFGCCWRWWWEEERRGEGRAEEVCDAFPSFRPSRETAELSLFENMIQSLVFSFPICIFQLLVFFLIIFSLCDDCSDSNSFNNTSTQCSSGCKRWPLKARSHSARSLRKRCAQTFSRNMSMLQRCEVAWLDWEVDSSQARAS